MCRRGKLRGRFKNFLRRKKVLIIFVSLLLFAGLIYFLFAITVNPVILNTVEVKSDAIVSKAINSAIADVVMNSIIYDDLIEIVYDNDGNVSLIYANALEINNLSRDLAQTTERRIEQYGSGGIQVPLGNFSGIPMMVGRGPIVNIFIKPIGSVLCSFLSQFESAGINQTNHKIYLNIKAEVGVVLPLLNYKFSTEQQVLISESIIVGKVPQTYLYYDKLDPLLNLVP